MAAAARRLMPCPKECVELKKEVRTAKGRLNAIDTQVLFTDWPPTERHWNWKNGGCCCSNRKCQDSRNKVLKMLTLVKDKGCPYPVETHEEELLGNALVLLVVVAEENVRVQHVPASQAAGGAARTPSRNTSRAPS